MPRRFAIVFVLATTLVGCGAPEGPRAQRACDDGGSGGVIIDGVCL